MAKEKNIKIDASGFEKEFENHQHLSKTASAGMFKGGMLPTQAKKQRDITQPLTCCIRL